MHPVGNLFRSTIGRKFLMAVTGLILIGFVIGHLVGNLQVFEHPDKLNGYAAFLQSLGPLLWTARIVLLVSVVIHIWAATTLALESKASRAKNYETFKWLRATFASRYMRWTGYVVLAFIVYHLAQFTFGSVQSASYKENLPPYMMTADYKVAGFTVVKAGAIVPDTRSMVIHGFENPIVAIFYIIAVGLLSLHLLHGGESLFQTFGWRNANWARGLRAVVTVGCLLYFLGNLAIPGGVMAGVLKDPYAPQLHTVTLNSLSR